MAAQMNQGNETRHTFAYAVIKDEQFDSQCAIKDLEWIVDTGASAHMTADGSLYGGDTVPCNGLITSANGSAIGVTLKGDITLQPSGLQLNSVLWIPDKCDNIISVSALTSDGYDVEFGSGGCVISIHGVIVAEASRRNGLYIMGNNTIKEVNLERNTIFNVCKAETSIFPLDLEEPEDWADVQKYDDDRRNIWIQAMKEELQVLEEAGAWKVVEKPSEGRIIPCRWIYKVKFNQDSAVVGVRARLVAKGCSQRPGWDYGLTYAPVVSQGTIRAILTIAGKLNFHVRHLDVNAAFLYGEIEESLYMQPPPGPWKYVQEDQCMLLKSAIYGLKQAARAWNMRINSSLLSLGFIRSDTDHCLYYLRQGELTSFIIIHVDDLLFVSGDVSWMDNMILKLSQEYQLKDLGRVNCYLGMHIELDPITRSYNIHQRPKLAKLIKDMGMENATSKETPMTVDFHKHRYDLDNEPLADNLMYQKIIGLLLYLSTTSRPDISLATNILGRNVARPKLAHWNALIRIIRYLKGTIDYRLNLDSRGENLFTVYCDADWGGNMQDRKSTSGYLCMLGASPILWGARKQECVALSTSEAEYVALATGLQQLLWVKGLTGDLNLDESAPVTVFSDNQSCIAMAESEHYTGRTKHIDIRYHFVKSLVIGGTINLEFCPTDEMLADFYTKPLDAVRFKRLREKIGIFLHLSFMGGC